MGLNKDDVVFKSGMILIVLDKDAKIIASAFKADGALKVRDSSGGEVGEMEPQKATVPIKKSSLPKFTQVKLNALVLASQLKLAEKFGAAAPPDEFDFGS